MTFHISIVIYNLIREICTEILCKKHNTLPVCRGHTVSAAKEQARKRGVEPTAAQISPYYFGASLAILRKADIIVA